VNVVDHSSDLQQQHEPENDEYELRDQVREREHQVQHARLLDAEYVEDDECGDQDDRGQHVRLVVVLEVVQKRQVLAEHAQVADGEVGRDRDSRRVVQELDPSDQEPDRSVEGAPGEAGAATRMRKCGGSLRVVQRRRDEDEAGEDQSEWGQPQGECGGDAERVVDARSDIAVTGREQRRRAKGAWQLGGAADDDPQIAWPAAAPGD